MATPSATSAQSLSSWLEEGPFTLALSSGFFGFFAHGGVVAALEERGFRPSKVTGASAGALVAGGLASGLRARDLKFLFESVRRQDFWDPWPGLGLLRGEKFRRILERHFVPTFQDAEIPVEVAAVDLLRWRASFLREGSLARAVYASCAVPLMFQPIRIDGRLWVDGGVLCKSGATADAARERTLCVYLATRGAAATYERKLAASPLGPESRVLRFNELPAVGPRLLGNGPLAYRSAYRRAGAALDMPSPGRIVDV